ncbi:hypothetical protein [Aeromicrobium duanguangcaii]|uniref:hypothetical protein n=1 Tax=Aeromicrobium duanguangcaii TaxID=2968086 RepID=UPI002016FA90|nr:hypothetical protein [Aeromicrobium duanguangcaii]MCL3836887.1 hypothetical protein [Aeromicrobium duanguangcaii]
MLQHSGAELSAHQTIEVEQERWTSIAQLAAEYETIAAVAQHDRWADLIRRSGLTEHEADAVIASDSFGPFTAELRRAEADRFDVEDLLPRLVRRRSLDDADDIGAVLVTPIRHATSRRTRRLSTPDLIAGLLPAARGPMTDEMDVALTKREHHIRTRSRGLAESAVERGDSWLTKLGTPPKEPARREQWLAAATTVAANRDRWCVEGLTILGHSRDDLQRLDVDHAGRAIRQARAISDATDTTSFRALAHASPTTGLLR